MALISCDQDEVLANLARPPMSTIDHGMLQIGFQAAALLDRAMSARRLSHPAVVVAPVGVVERQSTNLLAMGDPAVNSAMRYIRAHATEGASAADLLAQVGGSRRKLEIAFRKTVGRKIQQQIHRQRIEHAGHLLLETDLTLPRLAEQCGYSSAAVLHHHFRRQTGVTPGVYRDQNRATWEP